MTTRVQVLLSDEERERFRRLAERRGQSLSSWMREAARERATEEPPKRLQMPEDFRRFFTECDAREGEGREPDWEDHRRALESALRSGASDP
jgi:hypothetical protein